MRAWYHVGAPQIVMSLWNIDDNATKDLMLEFMGRLEAGAATEFALRDAMLATRQTYADPALWASVALFGLPSKVSRQPERVAPHVALPEILPTPRTMMVPQGPAQRAVLYEEDPQDPGGRQFMGSVVWGTALLPGVGRRNVEIRGEIAIPERKLVLAWSLRRNSDPTMAASHIVELTFAVPAEVGGGGIQNVPGIMVKDSEKARGALIAGMSVRVSAGYFLIGLTVADVQANQSLLKEGRWLDIPIVYEDGRRAILAIEKGSPGEHAFDEVFAFWSASP